MNLRKGSLCLGFVLVLAAALSLSMQAQKVRTEEGPQFTAGNKLIRSSDYREWIWLSSGLGMSYQPASSHGNNSDPEFDNVFATPEAYRSFLANGKWPDKTMLVLEVRASVGRQSINQSGHFQGNLTGLEVEVKDESRSPGKWSFYAFGTSSEPVAAIPRAAACYSCHAQNGAVDNTFVQFYPTLLEIAKRKGSLRLPQAE